MSRLTSCGCGGVHLRLSLLLRRLLHLHLLLHCHLLLHRGVLLKLCLLVHLGSILLSRVLLGSSIGSSLKHVSIRGVYSSLANTANEFDVPSGQQQPSPRRPFGQRQLDPA
jgi:hypothetical protein